MAAIFKLFCLLLVFNNYDCLLLIQLTCNKCLLRAEACGFVKPFLHNPRMPHSYSACRANKCGTVNSTNQHVLRFPNSEETCLLWFQPRRGEDNGQPRWGKKPLKYVSLKKNENGGEPGERGAKWGRWESSWERDQWDYFVKRGSFAKKLNCSHYQIAADPTRKGPHKVLFFIQGENSAAS